MAHHKIRSFFLHVGPFKYHGVLRGSPMARGFECEVAELTRSHSNGGDASPITTIRSAVHRDGPTLDACLTQLAGELEAFCRADAVRHGWNG